MGRARGGAGDDKAGTQSGPAAPDDDALDDAALAAAAGGAGIASDGITPDWSTQLSTLDMAVPFHNAAPPAPGGDASPGRRPRRAR